MAEFSFLIPARNEEFCARTVEDILAHARGDFEIIVVLDGAWADPPIKDSQRVRIIYKPEPIGQRAATNLAARLATGKYICKLDAHCSIAEGFDCSMMAAVKECGRDTTAVPAMCNLHAFSWSCACGNETYQGPTPTICAKCQQPGPFKRVMYWDLNAGGVPGRKMRTEFWRFDSDIHFAYHGPVRPGQADAPIADVMSSVGACFVMRRDRFIEIGGLDEAHGSWGQFGVEIACKSWLSGGTHVVARNTWFAHLFRTQGGDFAFPYPMRGSDQERARKHSRHLWLGNNWPGQTRPLSWLIEHFAPIRGWHKPSERKEDEAVRVARMKRLEEVMAAGSKFANRGADAKRITRTRRVTASDEGADGRIQSVVVGSASPGEVDAGSRTQGSAAGCSQPVTTGLLYYSDGRCDARILQAVRAQIRRAVPDLPLVSVTLQPLDFGENLVLYQPRGALTMFRQILMGLEALTTDVVFFVEHDVLYHAEHFLFVSEHADRFYYNQNRWQVNAHDGQAAHYLCCQTAQLCADRALLVEHYRRRIAAVEAAGGYDRNMGYEPGTNKWSRSVDPHGFETRMSAVPNIDIRHGKNLSKTRWLPSEFRDKKTCRNWVNASGVPGWGETSGRFDEFLAGLGV